jgi:hypothetical protein
VQQGHWPQSDWHGLDVGSSQRFDAGSCRQQDADGISEGASQQLRPLQSARSCVKSRADVSGESIARNGISTSEAVNSDIRVELSKRPLMQE